MSKCHCGCRATHVCACDSGPFCRECYFKHVDEKHDGMQIVFIPYPRRAKRATDFIGVVEEMRSVVRG
jgi:hypothetical protein